MEFAVQPKKIEYTYTHKHNKNNFFFSLVGFVVLFEFAYNFCLIWLLLLLLALLWLLAMSGFLFSNFYIICSFGWLNGFRVLSEIGEHKACAFDVFICIDCGSTNKQIKFKWWSWSFCGIDWHSWKLWVSRRWRDDERKRVVKIKGKSKSISKQFKLTYDNNNRDILRQQIHGIRWKYWNSQEFSTLSTMSILF